MCSIQVEQGSNVRRKCSNIQAGSNEHKELAASNGHPMQAIAQKGSAHVRNLHVP